MNRYDEITKMKAGEKADGRFIRSRAARQMNYGGSSSLSREHDRITKLIEEDPSRKEELIDMFNARAASLTYSSDRY